MRKVKIMHKIILGIILAGFALVISTNATLMPVDLRCDYAVNPLGMDSQNPRLSWKLEGI